MSKRETVQCLRGATSVKAGSVSVSVIGSPFGDGRIRRSRWEEHNHSKSVSASISQYAETHNGNLTCLIL
jgi:hypothetical protein